MSRTILIIIALALVPALASCGKKEADQAGTKPAVKKQALSQAPPMAPIEISSSIASTADVRARNPFQSHLILMKGLETGRKAKGPLECCEISSFKLIAVVVGTSGSEGFGLVQGQDGRRYIIRPGDVMGSRAGRVVKLTSSALYVREVLKDEQGKVKSSEDIELRLPDKQKQ